MKINFSKKDLFEIEKQFDINAGMMAKNYASLISIHLKLASRKSKTDIEKIMESVMEAYHHSRTISAIACKLRGGE